MAATRSLRIPRSVADSSAWKSFASSSSYVPPFHTADRALASYYPPSTVPSSPNAIPFSCPPSIRFGARSSSLRSETTPLKPLPQCKAAFSHPPFFRLTATGNSPPPTSPVWRPLSVELAWLRNCVNILSDPPASNGIFPFFVAGIPPPSPRNFTLGSPPKRPRSFPSVLLSHRLAQDNPLSAPLPPGPPMSGSHSIDQVFQVVHASLRFPQFPLLSTHVVPGCQRC